MVFLSQPCHRAVEPSLCPSAGSALQTNKVLTFLVAAKAAASVPDHFSVPFLSFKASASCLGRCLPELYLVYTMSVGGFELRAEGCSVGFQFSASQGSHGF